MVMELGGREEHTTNNRMELTAVLEGLRRTTHNDLITVYTDSSYVLKGSTLWLSTWKKNDWMTKGKDPVLNKDIWVAMDDLLSTKKITWKLLPGHSGIPANERCDEIATTFADNLVPDLYSGKISEYGVDITVLESEGGKKPSRSKQSAGKAYSYVSMVNGEILTHTTWEQCEKRVKGVKNTKFKKAMSLEDEQNIIREWRKISHI
jgi:ribonuclease HI